MATAAQVNSIVSKIESMIAASGKPLRVVGHHLDDTWLTVVITSGSNVRASEYADFMSEIERALRKDGYDEVVLVPALAA
jgi:hypothetical protein